MPCPGRGSPPEDEGLPWLSHRAHYSLWPPGGALCTRVGRSSSASLVRRCASVSSGGCGLAGARRLSGGWLCRWSWVLWGRGVEQCSVCGRMRWLEAGRSSIARVSAFPFAHCSPPGCCVGGDPCGRALGGSPPSRVHTCKRASSKQQRSRWVGGIITVAGRTAARTH